MASDLRWWFSILSSPSITRPLRPQQDFGLYFDASTSWGIGIVIGDLWASFQLSSTWNVRGRDICWLVTIAIELLVYFLETMSLRDTCLIIHSNNQGTIGDIWKAITYNGL